MTAKSSITLWISASAIAVLCTLAMAGLARADGADKEYQASMKRMDAAMMKAMDPDPTKAWAKMMIAHHQGAIEMSQTVLKETKDPIIRQMAEKSIKDQSEEQKMLQKWIDAH